VGSFHSQRPANAAAYSVEGTNPEEFQKYWQLSLDKLPVPILLLTWALAMVLCLILILKARALPTALWMWLIPVNIMISVFLVGFALFMS
jgi:hypothetical protein